MFYYSNYSVCN